MQLHYIDRDLYRTGNSVVVVSAGSGVFQVDKNLAAITKQRMMDNGIGKSLPNLEYCQTWNIAKLGMYQQVSGSIHNFNPRFFSP